MIFDLHKIHLFHHFLLAEIVDKLFKALYTVTAIMSAMEDEASTSADYTDIPSTSTSQDPSPAQTATDTDRDSFYFESDHVALKGRLQSS